LDSTRTVAARLAACNRCLALSNCDVRVTPISDSLLFSAYSRSEDMTWHVSSLGRTTWLYDRGFRARAEEIGLSYNLSHVVINDGDIIIDCGANYGDLRLYLNSLPAVVRYVAVEPANREFNCLTLNCSATRDICFHAALAERDGYATLYDDFEGANSSMIAPPKVKSEYTVETLTLSTLLKRLGLTNNRIRLLKLEAEGFEPEICAGATAVLPQIDYIAADVGFERGLKEESTAPQVTNFLLNHNFSLHAVAPPKYSLRFLYRNNNCAS